LVADHAANVLVPPPATERTAGERPTALRPTPRGRAADLFPASPDSRTFVRPGNPGLASDAVATASPEAPLAGRAGAPSSAVTENADFTPTGDTSRGQPTTDGRNGKFKILGVLNRLYILMENAGGLVLVDQHAAHERILFEELRRRLEADEVPSQKLLLPQTLQLGPRDADWLRQNLPALQKMGIGLEDFGAGAFKLDSVPPFLQVAEPLALVREIIDSLQSAVASTSRLRLGEEMIAKTVCRHAVKANDRLRERELVKLLEDLMACELPYCCPHGRPTMIELSYAELERKFGRRA
jgi:DNA mismatch repair protein MutL